MATPSLVAIGLALVDRGPERRSFFRRFLELRMAWWRTVALFYGLAAVFLLVLGFFDPQGVATMVTAELTLGAGRTGQAPGTTQALRRSSIVHVEVDGMIGAIRRPNVIGALLGKAAAVTKIRSQSAANRSKHLRDFDSLATLLAPHDRTNAGLTKGERRTLQDLIVEPTLSELGIVSLDLLLGQ